MWCLESRSLIDSSQGEDIEDNTYKPGRTLADSDTDDDADLLEEVERDYSNNEWEEENKNGDITVHKGGGPKPSEVEEGL